MLANSLNHPLLGLTLALAFAGCGGDAHLTRDASTDIDLANHSDASSHDHITPVIGDAAADGGGVNNPDAASTQQDPGCPTTQPRAGSACSQADLRCRYPSLSYSAVCSELRWTFPPSEEKTPCPAGLPEVGSPCPSGQACTYAAPQAGCSRERHADAVCAGESTPAWQIWQPASCAISDPLACDPRGQWRLTFDFDEDDAGTSLRETCNRPSSSASLYVRSTDAGELQILGANGEVSPEGCEIHARWTTYWVGGSEDGSHAYDVTLHVAGDTASGNVDHASSGFCPGKDQGSVHAQRVQP